MVKIASVLALAFLAFVASPATAGVETAFTAFSAYQTFATTDINAVAPANFSLSWPGKISLSLTGLTPADLGVWHTVTADNAATYGVDWDELRTAFHGTLPTGTTSVNRTMSTPLGNLTPICCLAANRYSLPHASLYDLQWAVTDWRRPAFEPSVTVQIWVLVRQTTYVVPEPASLALLLPFGLLLIRHRRRPIAA